MLKIDTEHEYLVKSKGVFSLGWNFTFRVQLTVNQTPRFLTIVTKHTHQLWNLNDITYQHKESTIHLYVKTFILRKHQEREIYRLSQKEKDVCKQGNKHLDGIDESNNKVMNFHNKILLFPQSDELSQQNLIVSSKWWTFTTKSYRFLKVMNFHNKILLFPQSDELS